MSMPRVDWARFGRDVLAASKAAGSYRKLSASHDGVTVSMVSRAVNASQSHPVGVPSFLHLCACLELQVWDYYLLGAKREPARNIIKSLKDIVQNQTVAANVSREAGR